jgi:phosphopantothenoylcysteine decarboxylase/phosphopantothenate--cysteine ligase
MFKICSELFSDMDIAVLSAAVSDYKPKKIIQNKIKKESNNKLSIELVSNIDILNHLGNIKKKKPIINRFCFRV